MILSEIFINEYKTKKPPMTELGNFVYYRTYSRFIPELKRREYWYETVERAVNYNCSLDPEITEEEAEELYDNIFNLRQFLSGRTLWVGGTESSLKYPASNYNCGFVVIDSISSFCDLFYLMMLGTGVGYRTLPEDTHRLGTFRKDFNIEHKDYVELDVKRQTTTCHIDKDFIEIVIGDSKEGWVEGLRYFLELHQDMTLSSNCKITINYDNIRKKGERLKTFGGFASGYESLKAMFEKIMLIFNSKENNTFELTTLDCLDICNILGENVAVGGTRRSAGLCLFDINDNDVLSAKNSIYYQDAEGNWQTNTDLLHRTKSNNSIAFNTRPSKEKLTEIFESIRLSGEPGFINLESGRKRFADMDGVNPCLTGDVLVYTADGRSNVSIKQLAEEGLDVDVFCLDDRGNTVIRKMRNPRVTGYNQPIFKVTLDSGDSIRVTGNHKFRLRDGSYKEVGLLERGDSLHHLVKKEASIKDIFPSANSNSQSYYYLDNKKFEHRIIAEHNYGKIPKGYVVHHKDFKGLHNHFSNLAVMSKKDHDNLHKANMLGDKNPMVRAKTEWSEEKWSQYRENISKAVSGENNPRYIDISDEDIIKHMVEATKLAGRRLSVKSWLAYIEDNNLRIPKSMKSRELGGIKECLIKVAESLDIGNAQSDPRLVKNLSRALALGYNAYIDNNKVYVKRTCEFCKKEFDSLFTRREVSFCSSPCSGKAMDQSKARQNATIFYQENKVLNKGKQLEVYTRLKCELGRQPQKIEWEKECKKEGIPFRVGVSSPFRTFKDLCDSAAEYNYRVVSVEFDGLEDVYNGTVDNFHNFFVGGFKSTMPNGKKSYGYLNNLQCGEILLPNKGLCNLTTVNVMAYVFKTSKNRNKSIEVNKLLRAFRLNARASLRLNSVELELEKWDKKQKEFVLIGCSMTGWQDAMSVVEYSIEDQKDLLNKIRKAVRSEAESYAAELGLNKPVLTTALKPEGTLSLLPTVSPGIHYAYAPYYIRRVRINSSDPLLKACEDLGYKIVPEVGQTEDNCNTKVVEFYVKSPTTKTIKDLTAIEQLEIYKMFMENYVEHNASNTITVKDHEWGEVVDWVYNNWDTVIGVTFLSYSDGYYPLMPYEAITKEQYDELNVKRDRITPELIAQYEHIADEYELENECVGGSCPIR